MSRVFEKDSDESLKIIKLERRLKRERDARLEAERIAERGLRDLYESKRIVELLESVAQAANSNLSVEETLQVAVDRICEYTCWPVGHAYLAERRKDELALVPTGVWHLGAFETLNEFREATEKLIFRSGVGLPGRAAASRAPVLISNLAEDEGFLRADVAEKSGLISSFAFPVLAGSDVVAVLEFYAQVHSELSPELLAVMAQVGNHLGRVFERERERQLYHIAYHDPLTQLPNRARLLDRLHHAFRRARRRDDGRIGLMFIDLDDFKAINDSYGHEAGDEVLVAFSGRLRDLLRGGDTIVRGRSEHGEEAATVARFGGDEFIILLDDLRKPEDAISVAERINSALHMPFKIGGDAVLVTASIGIAISTKDNQDPEVLLRQADMAMYESKNAGGSCFRLRQQG